MSGNDRKSRIGLFVAVGVAVLALSAPSFAGDAPSQDEILNALKPKRITRSLSVSPAEAAKAAEEQKFVDELRTNRRTRSLSTNEREKATEIAKDKPNIDIEINFGYNSAELSPQSLTAVDNLGKVISAQLKDGVFLLGGHTDAKGGEDYNQGLSERRAETVKRYLIEKYSIPADSLLTAGYGKSQPKLKDNPMADANRRVQVINMKSN